MHEIAPQSPVNRRAFLLVPIAASAVSAGCENREIDAPAELRIATGPPGAVYREVGGALATVLNQRLPRTRVRTQTTGASVDNLRLLARGETDLALAQLDATVVGLDTGVSADVTAVARLFDSWLHLVVPDDASIRRLADLNGRRVAVGARGSGTEFTVQRLLRLTPEVQPRRVNLTQEEEQAALRASRIDAFFTLTGVPTPAVSVLARDVRIRLVPLSLAAAHLNERHGEQYTSATIPASAYPGVPATETLTVPNLLLAQPGLGDALIELVTATLFAERARIVQGHPEARRINVRTGIATGSVRLHPGAVRYFRSHKW